MMLLTKLLRGLAGRVLGLKPQTRRQNRRVSTAQPWRSIEALEDRTLLSITGQVNGFDVVFSGDAGVVNSIVFSVDPMGFLQHNLGGMFGFASNFDLDSNLNGDQGRIVTELTGLAYHDQDSTPISPADDNVTFDSTQFDLTNTTLNQLIVNAGVINLASNARIITTANGAVNLTAAQRIHLGDNSNITSMFGEISLAANQQSVPLPGMFVGIQLNNASITSNTGQIDLQGRGGNQQSGNFGVQLTAGSFIRGGNVQIAGEGGDGDSSTYGVVVGAGATVTSNGSSSVLVKGKGGGSSIGSVGVLVRGVITSGGGDVNVIGDGSLNGSDDNYGVSVELSGQISVGPGGDVTVEGVAHGTGNRGVGVHVASEGRITSNGGNVQVTGWGSSSGVDSNWGVEIVGPGSLIAANGLGALTVTGFGGGNGVLNGGVLIDGASISTVDGNLTISGIIGGGPSGTGLVMRSAGALVQSTGAGSVLVVADSCDIDSGTSVTVGSGAVTLRPGTSGNRIDIGRTDDPVDGPLGLSDAELDRILTATLRIGGPNSGPITVVNSMDRTASTDVILVSDDVVDFRGEIDTGGGRLTINAASGTGAVFPSFFATDVVASFVDIDGVLSIEIGGLMPGETQTVLDVDGDLSLTGTGLQLIGGYTFQPGDTATIVTASHIVGTFLGLPDYSTVFLGGQALKIHYTDTDVTVKKVSPDQIPVISSAGEASVNENISESTVVLDVDASVFDGLVLPLTYSLSGPDFNEFSIDSATGEIRFVSSPDFEFPGDSGADNTYNVLVTVVNNEGDSTSQVLTISVLDVDDGPSTLTISDASIGEGNSGAVSLTFTVTSSDAIAGGFSVDFIVADITTSVMDYTISTVSPLNFTGTAGESQTITILVNGDLIIEGDETFTLTLGTVTAATPEIAASIVTGAVGTGTIVNDDGGTISIVHIADGAEGTPGTNGKFTVTQTAVSATDTVLAYSISGTATAGSDYAPLSGTVTILAGQTTADIPIAVLDDGLVEGTETITVLLTGFVANDPSIGLDLTPANLTASVLIGDDDSSVLTISNATVGEGNSGIIVVTFTVTSPIAVVGGFTVAFTVSDMTTSTTDYSISTVSPLSFSGAAGESQTITISVNGDLIVESDETFILTLGSVTAATSEIAASVITGAVATGTIVNDDGALVSISHNADGAEGSPETNGTFTVTQTAISATDTVVSYSISGTAIAGSDYSPLSGTVTIFAGQTSAVITVPVIDDVVVEGTETVTVLLTGFVASDSSIGLDQTPANLNASVLIGDDDGSVLAISSASVEEGNTGVVSMTFTVTSPIAVAGGFVVAFTSSDISTSNSDYTISSVSPLSFSGAAGESRTITINVNSDLIVEGNETLTLTLGTVTAATSEIAASIVTGAVAVGTIANDDGALVSIARIADGAEVAPGANGKFTVMQSAVSATDTVVSYSISGAATAGSDYVPLLGTVTIPAGQTSADINVTVLVDDLVEGSESVNVLMTGFGAHDPAIVLASLPANLTATVLIADDDSTVMTISNASVLEADTGITLMTFTVTSPIAVAGGFTVAFAAANISTSAADFTVLTPSPLNFIGAVGESQTITISVNGDLIVEGEETFTVTLGAVTAATSEIAASIVTGAVGTGTIANDDGASVSIVHIADGAEGAPGVNGKFTVTQTAVSATDTVLAYSVLGTATAGSDYSSLFGTLTIPAGQTTVDISVPVIDDDLVEGTETVTVLLTGFVSNNPSIVLDPTGAKLTASVLIDDNDTNVLTIGNASVVEGNSGVTVVTFIVTSTMAVVGGFTVAFTASDITTSFTDYSISTASPLSFSGIAGESQTITIIVNGDLIVEGDEAFTLTLGTVTAASSVIAARVVTGAVGSGTIANDDAATVSMAQIADGAEGSPNINGKFIVTQTAVSTTDTVVSYVISGTATGGVDYSPLSGTVTIPAGQTTADISVTIVNDVLVEGIETVTVLLTGFVANDPSIVLNPTPASLTATVLIGDDDTSVLTISSESVVEGNAGITSMTFTVTSPIAIAGGFTVAFSAADIFTNSTDYAISTLSPLNFSGAAGESQTITINVNGDLIIEGDETFTLILGSVTAATPAMTASIVTGAGGTATIVNDDFPSIISVATATVEENSSVVTVVLDVDAEPVPGQTLQYSLTGPDAGRFQINDLTGEIRFATIPDFDSPTDVGGDNIYNVIVSVDNGLGATTTQLLTITVVQVVATPPVFVSSAAATIEENLSSVLTVIATDADLQQQVVTYTITGGPDRDLFTIDSSSGELAFRVAPDFELPRDVGLENAYHLTVTASDGTGLTTGQDLVVTVVNVNEPLVITVPGATSDYLPGSGQMVIDPTASASDPDTTDYSFNKSILTVAVAGVMDTHDRLKLLSQGTGPGKLSILHGHVVYESSLVIVGKILTGLDGGPLQIQFTSFITREIVDKLLRVITFSTTGDAASGSRTISFHIENISGTEQRETTYKTIDVVGQRRPQLVPAPNVPIVYSRGTSPLSVFVGSFDAAQGTDLKGSRLLVTITEGASRKNRLKLMNLEGISVSGRDVQYHGEKLGRLKRSQNSLRVDLSGTASPVAVQALLRSITFSTASTTTSQLDRSDRVLQFGFTDSRGNRSTSTQSIEVN